MTDDKAPIAAETNIIGNNRRVSRYAVAAGVTSIAAEAVAARNRRAISPIHEDLNWGL